MTISPGERVVPTVVPTGATAAAPERGAEDELRRCVERIVAARAGGRSAVVAVERRRSDEASSYGADVLTVRLAGGGELELFLKDFGFSRLRKDEPVRQRDRELRVYRELLADPALGTARYEGCLWDESRERYWLFLEHVRGTPLAYLGFEYWIAAAGWLARLQHHVAERASGLGASSDVLLRHDAAFYWSTARLALAATWTVSATLGDRLSGALTYYDRCVDAMMAAGPPTLVHGAYKPRHVLVDTTREPRRLCPVDWELAAVGSPLYDLAFLAYGYDAEYVALLLDEYGREASAHGMALPPREQMRHAVDCFRLHRILKVLGGAERRTLAEPTVAMLVDSAERLAGLVCRHVSTRADA